MSRINDFGDTSKYSEISRCDQPWFLNANAIFSRFLRQPFGVPK